MKRNSKTSTRALSSSSLSLPSCLLRLVSFLALTATTTMLTATDAFSLLPLPTISLTKRRSIPRITSSSSSSSSYPFLLNSVSTKSAVAVLAEFEAAFEAVKDKVCKTCKVKPALFENNNQNKNGSSMFVLVATTAIPKGDVILAMPYKDSGALTPSQTEQQSLYQKYLPQNFQGWTGNVGLLALELLHQLQMAASCSSNSNSNTTNAMQLYKEKWLATLPHIDDCRDKYPLLWPNEEDQEVLQYSSTTKIFRILDDIEEDVTWLTQNVFDQDRTQFPETVQFNGRDYPCFNLQGFLWAYAIVQDKSYYLDGEIRLIPLLDMVRRDDDDDKDGDNDSVFGREEVQGGVYMGNFRNIQGAQLRAHRDYKPGEVIYCSAGPKSAIDYLLEHGFVPASLNRLRAAAVSELTFEINPKDRFYDDKLDILKFETYDVAPMDPCQKFVIVSIPGRLNDGQPDPGLLQFVRFAELGGTDAFLLESIFRKDVWDFMSLPVSEINELAALNSIIQACQQGLNDFDQVTAEMTTSTSPKHALCAMVRESERKALTKCIDFCRRDCQALDLKEYYQERRLKDLGLDSEWSPDDDGGGGLLGAMDENDGTLSFGQKRAPGGADYDW